uniref:hypothetical protein n=1 Tax=Klebsiella pneumoniae TaxID=573 RepID=UPI001E36D859|nr:hypothetical protein [Klebsiella pneumoniae]
MFPYHTTDTEIAYQQWKSLVQSRFTTCNDDIKETENIYCSAHWSKTVLVVSSVSVFITNQGCFSTLLSHLKAHCKNKSYLLKIESVISQELRRYLVRQMFVFIGEEWECGSGYWVPEDDPVYPSLNTLPY